MSEVDEIASVPLASYAAVMAALAEPFPLQEALAAQNIAEEVWPDADLGWTERLVDDAALLARYEVELAAAQDRMTRSVDPLDDDIGAWVAFLGALGGALAPADVLASHGLGPNDLARLRRAWDQRMKADATLEKRARELQKRGGGRVPRVRAGPPSLAGSRRAPAVEALEPPAPPPLPPVEAVDAARLRDHRRRATQLGLGPAPALPHARRIEPAAPFVAPVPSARAPSPPPEPRPRPPAHRDDEPTRTRLVLELPLHELPFRATPSREYLEALDGPGADDGEGSDGETAQIVLADLQERVPEEHTVTSMAVPARAKPLPFERKKEAFRPWQTIRLFDVPEIAQEPDESELPTRVVEKRPLPRFKSELFEDPETAAEGVAPIVTPLPFIAHEDDDEEDDGGGYPFATLEQHGEISLERHASICVEIAIEPEHAAEIFARYGVTAEAKERADHLYRELFEQDATVRAAWNRAFDLYRAWFLSRR